MNYDSIIYIHKMNESIIHLYERYLMSNMKDHIYETYKSRF